MLHVEHPSRARIALVLPYPVSANRYWRSFVPRGHKRAIVCLSDDAKAFKREVGWIAREAGVTVPFVGTVELHIRLVPKNRVCMDLDNALKVTIDALKGIVYADDAQVYRIVAERADPDPTGARTEVSICPLVLPTALEAAA
jgi:crossover junction endodeoxyribonuclease RusA